MFKPKPVDMGPRRELLVGGGQPMRLRANLRRMTEIDTLDSPAQVPGGVELRRTECPPDCPCRQGQMAPPPPDSVLQSFIEAYGRISGSSNDFVSFDEIYGPPETHTPIPTEPPPVYQLATDTYLFPDGHVEPAGLHDEEIPF